MDYTSLRRFIGMVCLGSAAVAATTGSTESAEPQRTAWGAPLIEGTWDFRTRTPLERPQEFGDRATLTPEEAAAYVEKVSGRTNDARTDRAKLDVEGGYNEFWMDRGEFFDDDLRTSLIVDPPDGRLPALTAAATARKLEQNQSRTPPVRDLFSYSADPTTYRPSDPEALGLSERCLVGFNAGPPLMPGPYNNLLRIIQTSDHVVLVTEMIHTARVVPLDGRDHLPQTVRRWSGDSVGRFSGNTLIVETTNFTDKTPAYQLPVLVENPTEAGAVGSGVNLHLIERFTPTAEGRLEYEYTLTDPSSFVRPFTVRFTLRATEDQLYEYACHEGNYAMGGILRGARLLESEQAGGGDIEVHRR